MIYKKVVIVIPIHKTIPNEMEIASLLQCFLVFKKREISFICSKELDTKFYEETSESYHVNFRKIIFPKKFFVNQEGYNKLCMDKYFYKKFKEYEYMLIYQLDAWAFFDDLDKWCEMNYDYIGAPMPTKTELIKHKTYIDCNVNELNVFDMVGNGGFSLRKISKFIGLCSNKWLPILNFKHLFNIYKTKVKKNPIWIFWIIIRRFGWNNSINRIIKNWHWEDRVFAHLGNLGIINTPPVELSVSFAFECLPDVAFHLNRNKLPMGVHSWFWRKYFWKDYISYFKQK